MIVHGDYGMKNKKRLEFWKGKKVFITGHTGFKGAWLAFVLKSLGAKVYGYSLKSNHNFNLFNVLKLKKYLDSSCIGNILDRKKLNQTLNNIKPEIVFHLAAQSLVGKSYHCPLETFEINVIGSLNVLNACKEVSNIKSILMITTDKVYKNSNKIKSFKESDILGGSDPYSGSKSAAEMSIESFKNSFFKKKNKHKLAVVRSGNIIGGGDWNDGRIVPDIIKSIINKKNLLIRMPSAIRPWQHVLETVWAYMILSQELYLGNSKAQSSWNIGPNKSSFKKVIEIVNDFKKSFVELNFSVSKNKKFDESKILMINNQKMKREFNWKPVLSKQESFRITIDWYKEFLNNGDLNLISQKQVDFFFKKLS